MAFYREGRSDGDFDAGIGKALSAVLINPEFLFRVEADPGQASAGGAPTASAISSWHPACRSFSGAAFPTTSCSMRPFGASSAGRTCSSDRSGRMLADPRSSNLASNFAGQWLRLRNLESVDPNVRLYPDFDDNLRQAFRLETELFVDSVLREDRSVLDLLRADYTFLNERLAKHYGIPNVYGSRFRRVALAPDSKRGGLLRHGSILSVTSYATRTSPVLRGVWVLSNIFGAPPPPPLPNVPALEGSRCPPTCRCGRGWPPIAATRCARAVTGRSTRWDSRWRTSTRWVAGGITTGTAGPLTCRGPCLAPASSKAWPVSKKGCSAVRSCSPER